MIKADLVSPIELIQGKNLIYVYQTNYDRIVQPVELSPKELLFPPLIVNNAGWTSGFFQTVYSTQINEKDYASDYGFYKSNEKKFVNEEGQPLGYEPKMWDIYALSSHWNVGKLIHKALQNS
ncbi:hypothetical protein GTO91_11530 [Heliobacterium undosum]|uniref:Uncharacterized protein n=1 Tax=Heliomicrobium undosum TaxID=121734 RepID=A0A845L1B1_9FIRM|nr:hypothetical protein [Heliomicrobium undosum]